MISQNLPVPPDIARRIVSQLRSRPPGWSGTAAEIASQMTGMDARTVEGHLKALESHSHLVVREYGGHWQPDRWRLGL